MRRETASSVAARSLGAERWAKEDRGPIVCPNCARTFEGYVLWRSYCSPKCKRQAAYHRRKAQGLAAGSRRLSEGVVVGRHA